MYLSQIQYKRKTVKSWFRLWTCKRNLIPYPDGRAMWCLFLSSWDKEHHKISRAHCIGHKPTLRLHITDNSEHLFGWGAFIRDNIPAFPHNWVHFVRTIFRLQEGNVTWGTIDNLKQINHTSQLYFLNLLCAYFFLWSIEHICLLNHFLSLTHWPLRDLNEILPKWFQDNFTECWLRYLL